MNIVRKNILRDNVNAIFIIICDFMETNRCALCLNTAEAYENTEYS